MSTTRSQKRQNIPQGNPENVSEILASPIFQEESSPCGRDILLVGPSSAKSPRIEGSTLEELRSSLKEEITSEIRNLLAESQRELLKLLKPKQNEPKRDQNENPPENECRDFYTPTRSVRISSTLNDDTNERRNTCIQLL